MDIDTNGSAGVLDMFFDGGAFTSLFGSGKGPVSVAFGMVGGQAVYAICQNGEAVAPEDLINCCKTLELAAKTGNPVVTFYNSKGLVLDEDLSGLVAVSKLNAAIANISGVVPQLAVVTGVCGGSSAMYAANADLMIVSSEAQLFFTSPFISQANGDKTENAGKPEFAASAGVAAVVAGDLQDTVEKAVRLVGMLPPNNLSEAAGFEYAQPETTFNLNGYSAKAAVETVADKDSAFELYSGFGLGTLTMLCTVEGRVCGLVATNGTDSYIGEDDATKISRFVRLCDSFNLPVITLINSGGFVKSSSSDAAGGLRLAARLSATYADATTAKLAVVTGRAVGTAYAALGFADLTIAVEGAVIATAEPSAVVSVLYKEEIENSGNPIEAETRTRAEKYTLESASADAALKAGVADMTATAQTLRKTAAVALDILATKRAGRLPKKHGNMAL